MFLWVQMVPETVLHKCMFPPAHLTTVYTELPSAFRKQSRNVDVTEITVAIHLAV